MAITALEDYIRDVPAGGTRDRAAEWTLLLYWRDYPRKGMPLGLKKRPKIFAEINHGRWIVRCPFCPSAQLASKTDHRFFCIDCENADAGGQWLEVTWPDEVDQIQTQLVKRVKAENRNWLPNESVAALRRENGERGVR